MATIGNLNLEMYRGDTFQKTFTISKDLTDTQIDIDIKTTEDGTLIDSFSTTTGEIEITSISATSSIFVWTIPNTSTKDYDFEISKYDIQFTFPTFVKTYIEGTITLNKDITTD